MAPLLEAAELVRAALPPIPGGEALDARLLSHITQRRRVNEAVDAVGAFARRELRHPGRILITGAVSSAAVGWGSLLALRRGGATAASHQPAHR